MGESKYHYRVTASEYGEKEGKNTPKSSIVKI
jgi:hypothetical protein